MSLHNEKNHYVMISGHHYVLILDQRVCTRFSMQHTNFFTEFQKNMLDEFLTVFEKKVKKMNEFWDVKVTIFHQNRWKSRKTRRETLKNSNSKSFEAFFNLIADSESCMRVSTFDGVRTIFCESHQKTLKNWPAFSPFRGRFSTSITAWWS